MATGQTRLQKRGGRYYIRVKVPHSLRSIVGKREFHLSLKTTDPEEARRLARIESLRIDAQLSEARRKLGQAPVRLLSRSDAEYLALKWFHSEEAQSLCDANTPTDYDPEEHEFELGQTLDRLRNPNDETLLPSLQATLRQLLASEGFELNFSNQAVRYLDSLIRRGMAEHTRRELERLHGNFAIGGGDTLFNSISGDQKLSVSAPITLGQLIDRFHADRPSPSRSPKTVLKRSAQKRIFEEVLGVDTPVSAIDRSKARKLREVFEALPDNAAKRFPSLSAVKAAQLAREKGIQPMAVNTANSYLSAFTALMQYAVEEDIIAKNPAANLRLEAGRVARKDLRQPFSIEQLTKIFDAPLYRGCVDDEERYAKPGLNVIRRGRFWVPLISLFTGMRLNEICQLHVADIQRVDETDVILVHQDDEGIRRVKTESGERYVPIHPTLKDIGLLDHLAGACKRGDTLLFPELTVAKSTGYFSDNFSKWFSRFLLKAGAKTRNTSFHSFRHSYRDALREADISRERVQALGGWASGRTEDDYGSGLRPRTLAREIEKVRYDLDLSHLYLIRTSHVVLNRMST